MARTPSSATAAAVCMSVVLVCLAGPVAAMNRKEFSGSYDMAWNVVHEETHSNGEKTQTLRSQAFPLGYGSVVFTDPDTTFLKFPTGRYHVTSFNADVVDERNVSVPLSEAYLHHWIIFNGKGNAGVCDDLGYVFGVGAESRGTTTRYPDGYGLPVDGDEVWTANIHIIRTVGLQPYRDAADNTTAIKRCIECSGPNQWCTIAGGFACCPDGSHCPRLQQPVPEPAVKNYYLQYTITFVPDNAPAATALTPLDIIVLDASNCMVEYNINATSATPGTTIVPTSLSYHVPHDFKLVYAVGHIHIAGNDASFNVVNTVSGDKKTLCTSHPTYGTQPGVPGNEAGYVVSISSCSWPQGLVVEKGSRVELLTHYTVQENDPRTFDGGPEHTGVMSLMLLAFEKDASRVGPALVPTLK